MLGIPGQVEVLVGQSPSYSSMSLESSGAALSCCSQEAHLAGSSLELSALMAPLGTAGGSLSRVPEGTQLQQPACPGTRKEGCPTPGAPFSPGPSWQAAGEPSSSPLLLPPPPVRKGVAGFAHSGAQGGTFSRLLTPYVIKRTKWRTAKKKGGHDRII